MHRASRYLLGHFSALFSTLFFILFFITSIIFLIKVTALTAVIQMNFWELGTLYLYLLPRTLLYTLPVTFFIALALSLFALSRENETTVLFTLGYDPKKIARLFLGIAALLSCILIIDLLVLIPLSKQLNDNFIDYKKAEAKFNIKASEFGQKFSEWFVFIENSDTPQHYQGITLYQLPKPKENEKLILAKEAMIDNQKGILRLALTQGSVFEIAKESIDQISFERMHINAKPKDRIGGMQGVMSYWNEAFINKRRAYDLAFFMLIALFPLVTTLIALSIGIVTYRYRQGSLYGALALCIGVYFAAATLVASWAPFVAPLIVGGGFMLFSYRLYLRKIKAIY